MDQLTLDVGELFMNIYKDVTAYIANVQLREDLPFELDTNYILGKIQTKPEAPYELLLYCCMSQTLARQIVYNMSKGNVSSQEEIIIYIREYMNITSGRAVSLINDHIGKSARFFIPEIQDGKLDLGNIERYECCTSVFFRSEYGEMILKVAYTINSSKKFAEGV